MSGHDITARDRVWAAIFEQQGRFRVADVRETIESDNRPSDETIRRVLRSATELETVTHQSGSPYYWCAGDSMAGYPNQSTEAILGRNFGDPEATDTEEFINQFLAERTDDVIYNENITDILNDERILRVQTSAEYHSPFGPHPSVRQIERKKRVWIAAFCQQFADADYIVLVDTTTGNLIDLSEHLDMGQFEQGTKILAIGKLRGTALFDEILNEVFETHRSTIEYRGLSASDDQEIAEHVQSRAKAFDPDSPEGAEQVESLVDEVVTIFDPNDPHEQSRLSEWVRSIAQEEVNSDGT